MDTVTHSPHQGFNVLALAVPAGDALPRGVRVHRSCSAYSYCCHYSVQFLTLVSLLRALLKRCSDLAF